MTRTVRIYLLLGCFLATSWGIISTAEAKKKTKTPIPPLVRLPGLNLKKFNVKPKIFIRTKKKKPKRKGRFRPPTRGGDTPRSFMTVRTVKTPSGFKKNPNIKGKRRGGTKPRTADDSPDMTRLVVYKRSFGRRAWRRKWMGHIIIKKGTITYMCPRPIFQRKLKSIVQRIQRAGLRHPSTRRPLTPKDGSFAWALRKQLERTYSFEVETQSVRPKR